MESTILQPSAGQTVVATNNGHHRHHDEHRRHDNHEWERALLREQAAGFRVAAQDFKEIERVSGVHAAASALGFAHLGEETAEGFCEVGKEVGAAKSAVIAAVTHGTEEAQENYAALQKQISDTATATVVGFKDAQAIAYQIEGRTVLDAAKNAAAIQLQAQTFASALSVQADKNAASIQLQAQTFASAAQLEAQKNASAIAAQLAECCCELKEKISADGDRTRALLNEQTIANLRDKAADADRKLAAYYAAKVPPVMP